MDWLIVILYIKGIQLRRSFRWSMFERGIEKYVSMTQRYNLFIIPEILDPALPTYVLPQRHVFDFLISLNLVKGWWIMNGKSDNIWSSRKWIISLVQFLPQTLILPNLLLTPHNPVVAIQCLFANHVVIIITCINTRFWHLFTS